jgi:hypothetical protein
MLGDNKPFDCRIWPYRIMDIGGRRAITMASICQEMYSRPLSQLVGFLKEGLADKIFAYADQHPEIVKHYYEGYPVKDMAKILDQSPETVKTWLRRAREQLKKRLGESFDD